MQDKQLKNKAIDFKGKKYVEVKERVKYFNDTYEKGSITTERLNIDGKEYFRAVVTPDCTTPNRFFTGHSQASFEDNTSFVNKTAATENAETSAVGRALAFMGIGVIDSIASVDEINKATNQSMAKEPDNKDNEFKDSVCKDCGGRIAISQGGKPYCTNRCWLPEGKHFRDEFKQQTLIVDKVEGEE